jgi:hypothetical protein
MATVRYLVSDVERAVAFYVERLGFDLTSTVAGLREAGTPFRNDIVSGPGGKQIVVDDPDGNPIELFEARR